MAHQAWISTVIIAICLTQVATCVKYVNVQCGIDWSVCGEINLNQLQILLEHSNVHVSAAWL